MTRGLSSAVKSQLASSSFVMAHLVKFYFNTIYRFTDYSSDISESFSTSDNKLKVNTVVECQSQVGCLSNHEVGQFVTGGGIPADTTIVLIEWDYDMFTMSNASLNTHVGSGYTLTFTDKYLSNGFLQGMGSISESSKLTVGSMDLVLSGVNQTMISDLLNYGHINKKVTIKRAYINPSTNALIESISIFNGRVDGMQINDTNDTSEINLTVSNHWSDFNRKSGRTTTSNSQQQFFPYDKGFDFITHANLT